MLLLRFVGLLLLRFEARKFDALLLKLPPRITRLELAPPSPGMNVQITNPQIHGHVAPKGPPKGPQSRGPRGF
jgi:hypothetical protein